MQKGIDYTGVTVVYICHDENGNILMNKRSKNCRDEHGRWDIGGGSVEYGDTILETLEKEIFEEYCTKILDHSFLGYRDVHREHNGQKTHWIALDFKVLIDKTTVKNGEPHKFDEINWFKIDSLPENVHSQFPVFLELYKDKIKF